MSLFEKIRSMNDKGFWSLVIIYIILVIADTISTVINGDLVKYLEANPLYKWGGLPLILLINLAILALYWWLYKRQSVDLRFYTAFCMVAICITRIIAIINNIDIYLHPMPIEQAMMVTAAEKQEYVRNLAMLNLLPALNAILTWLFFRKDHKIEVKG